jgi:FHS family L-fucose permease-like MFS transporter
MWLQAFFRGKLSSYLFCRKDGESKTMEVSIEDSKASSGVQSESGLSWTDAPDLQLFVFALFFLFGGVTSLNDVIIPKLKELFTLSYGEAMLVQSAFFTAYFVISIPAALVVRRIGYIRTASTGLLTMMTGCLFFIPASALGSFPAFLCALFALAAGVTTIQVVANPLISMLGPPHSASSRLTFAQAFNSVGTTLFPYVGALVILGSLSKIDPKTLRGAALTVFRIQETRVVMLTYVGLALALAVAAAAIWTQRNRLKETPAAPTGLFGGLDMLQRPRFGWGALCIFLYVGAEVAIGSLIVSYLEQASVLALPAKVAGEHVPLYWSGALAGRFIGAYVLNSLSPGRVLAAAAAAAAVLLILSANSHGVISAYALLSIGLFNSIMFPTIFTLASEGLGARRAQGSGIICMAIVGGAVIPPLTGHFADISGLKAALAIPGLCYGVIAAYGLYAHANIRKISVT